VARPWHGRRWRMRGMWQPHRHSAQPPVGGGLAKSTGDAAVRGISSRGRLVVTVSGGDAGTTTAPGLTRCLAPAETRRHLVLGMVGRRSCRPSLLLRLCSPPLHPGSCQASWPTTGRAGRKDTRSTGCAGGGAVQGPGLPTTGRDHNERRARTPGAMPRGEPDMRCTPRAVSGSGAGPSSRSADIWASGTPWPDCS
jgi:hypothetical protein